MRTRREHEAQKAGQNTVKPSPPGNKPLSPPLTLEACLDVISEFQTTLSVLMRKNCSLQMVFEAALVALTDLIAFEAAGFAMSDGTSETHSFYCWTPTASLDQLAIEISYLYNKGELTALSETDAPVCTPAVAVGESIVYWLVRANNKPYATFLGLVREGRLTELSRKFISILLYISAGVVERIVLRRLRIAGAWAQERTPAATDAKPENTNEGPGNAEAKAYQQPLTSSGAERVVADNLPGLDFVAGLANVGGDAKKLIKLLVQFEKAFADAPIRLRKIIETGDLANGERLVAGLIGGSGDLGATEVLATAKAIEQAFRCCDDDNFAGLLNRFEKALNILSNTIAVLGRRTIDAHAAPQNMPTADHMTTEKALKEIKSRLTGNELIDEHHLHALKSLDWKRPHRDQLNLLETHISKYNYEDALSVLNELADVLGIAP
ncbi:MAG: hypothetical protein HKP58_09445 [Desulfatitalea sp.]|nr:hypothetical protein [Desulfatitalea sp.]NNK00626.1 hypothetical protein [Desulfatitalea sp.]